MDYERGPAVKLGQGEYIKTWGSDEGAYDLSEDPTPADEIRATITPTIRWDRVAFVMCGAGSLMFLWFTLWFLVGLVSVMIER